MVTGYILHLTINTFLDVVVKNDFPLLSAGWYQLRVVGGNRYLPRGSNKNALYITSSSNVSLGNTLGNHTTFGFSHDSLNSGKFI